MTTYQKKVSILSKHSYQYSEGPNQSLHITIGYTKDRKYEERVYDISNYSIKELLHLIGY